MRRIALLARHACRPGDVGARFGGEEFVVLLPDTSLEGAKSLADQTLYIAKRAGRDRVDVAAPQAEAWRPGSAKKKLGARIAAFKIQRP
ncbi:MAG: Diguanylate cyclase, domain [Gammaproteobacteria bacterium]|nr:Diguanylate cyclase, domain [Gammaproteobacteria bacterium]